MEALLVRPFEQQPVIVVCLMICIYNLDNIREKPQSLLGLLWYCQKFDKKKDVWAEGIRRTDFWRGQTAVQGR